ncbi:DUF1642 domain-containing protein [Streptococcus pneumoniae]
MNKRELIEAIKNEPYEKGIFVDTIKFNRNWLLRKIEQLDEPEKVKIPQFVADWLKENDLREETLGEQSIFDAVDNLAHGSKNGYYSDVKRWIDENGDLFARAWLDGYEVEKEPKYTVMVKGVSGYGRYLNKALLSKEYFFASENEVSGYRTKHTRKELEEAGFGWVFDCEGVEVEEVEERG